MRALILVALVGCGFPPLDSQGGGDGSMMSMDKNSCGQLKSYPSGTSSPTADYAPATNQAPEELDYAADFSGPPDSLFVTLIADTSLFNNNISTGTFTLSGAESDVTTCGACVVVAGNCNGCNPYSNSGSGTYYVAVGGTLAVTSISGTMTGTLSNAILQHITISGSQTISQSVAADGCKIAVPTVSLSSGITNH